MTRPHVRHRALVELACLCCGHAVGEVDVAAGRRPTAAELRTAYAITPNVTAPAWDAHGDPRCPRCSARLFIEPIERRLRVFADDGFVRRARTAPEADEREDAYAREDVYVAMEADPA